MPRFGLTCYMKCCSKTNENEQSYFSHVVVFLAAADAFFLVDIVNNEQQSCVSYFVVPIAAAGAFSRVNIVQHEHTSYFYVCLLL